MAAIEFLAQWALRSSFLILLGALLFRLLRVSDPAVRLAAWTGILCGSLALPALTMALPGLPIDLPRAAAPAPLVSTVAQTAEGSETAQDIGANERIAPPALSRPRAASGDGLARAALWVYAVGALALLLRLALGFTMTLRLLNRSRATDRTTEGIEIRESEGVRVPVALGIARPAIVLPADWREWDAAKLEAVLAHERSHIRRHDPAVQALSAIHRALLWHSPLSWLLHTWIVRAAEEASDDAALAAQDRGVYAEVVLDFVRRAARPRYLPAANWIGAPMARYASPEKRIQRILDGTSLSRGVTRRALAAVLAIVSPLAYVAAAAHPQSAPPAPAAPAPVAPQLVQYPPKPAADAPAPTAARKGQPKQGPGAQSNSGYIRGMGQVTPSVTVTIRPRIDGQFESVNFKEGTMVKKGQLLATIDQEFYDQAAVRADKALFQDNAELRNAQAHLDNLRKAGSGTIAQSEFYAAQVAVDQAQEKIDADTARREEARLQLNYTRVESPIDGLAGFLQVDPGNMVHPNDAIVVVTAVQPIDVIVSIPEDEVFEVRARLAANANIPVEAWNRDESRKLATGRFIAMDNQIDQETGTAKLKAEFDNNDNALFPGQFVNVRLLVR